MLVALVPIVQALIAALGGGVSIGAALAGVGELQWLGLGDAILAAAPAEVALLRKLHPIFAHLADQVLTNKNGAIAPMAAQSWLSANADKAMQLQPGISSER